MISKLSVRRSAEEFAAAVDDRRPGHSGEVLELLGVIASLRELEPVAPRPEFAADLRGRLMLEAETALKPESANLVLPVREGGRRERRLVAAASAFVLVGGTTTMAAAAQDSLPGEALYPIKRTIERADAGLSLSTAGKGRDLLSQASRRLAEVDELVAGDQLQAEARVPGTLAEFSSSAAEGASLLFESFGETGDPATVVSVRTFAANSIGSLEGLAGSVPADAQDELSAAALLLRDLDREASALCGGCAADVPVVEVPGILLARAEVDRAMALAAQHELTNSHPVVVPKGTVSGPSRSDREVAPGGGSAAEESVRAPEAGTQVPDTEEPLSNPVAPPTWEAEGLPSLLPEVTANTNGSAEGGAGDTVTEDLQDGLSGLVETILPDPEGSSLLDSGDGSLLDPGDGSLLD